MTSLLQADRTTRRLVRLGVNHHSGDLFPQYRQQLRLEPGLALEPAVVAPGRVGQGQDPGAARLGQDLPPAPHRAGEPALHPPEMPRLRVLADHQDQFEVRQAGEQLHPPALGAFPAGRPVAAFRVQAWKACAHRQDGDAVGIIEFWLPQTKPVA